MAEFAEVMRQWNRMCKSIGVHDRIKCQFVHAFDIPNCESCSDYALEDPAKMEEIVMAWAAEHPEPVYPTWGEWLYEQDVLKDLVIPMPTINDDSTCVVAKNVATEKLDQQIPADIAQKLGIEPKEM